ncbi:MAG: hypothetical protein M8867_06350 [marine benthic group bacterium]|nr:hypothetical protein [Gemmatimonadota bacterium]
MSEDIRGKLDPERIQVTPAWYLPGYDGIDDPPEGKPDQPLAPALTEREATAVAETVRAAALRARDELSFEQVVRHVSRAAMRLADPGDPLGGEAELRLKSGLGWSELAARESLRGMAREWTEDALTSLVRSELGDPLYLERFVEVAGQPGRYRRATGPPLILQIHAGNVPGVPVSAAILALLARSGVLAKSGSDEPWMLPLFARALADENALLGSALAVTSWPGNQQPPALRIWAKESGKAIVYGGEEAVRALRGRLPPDTEMIVYGPRIGVAVFLSDAAEADPGRLAKDVLAYDQRGCVSPRLVLEVGSNSLELARRLERELSKEAGRLGPPPMTDEEAVAVRRARTACEFEGMKDGSTLVLGSSDLAWTVLARSRPGVSSEALPRTIWLYGVRENDDLGPLLRPLAGRIQAIGVAGRDGASGLAELAASLGVSRVCPVGSMAWPPTDWRQEGRHRLLPLLDWTEWENQD